MDEPFAGVLVAASLLFREQPFIEGIIAAVETVDKILSLLFRE